MTTDLPPEVGPTTMVVWRVAMVSFSWITLATWSSNTTYSDSRSAARTATWNFCETDVSAASDGKRSATRPWNSGTSSNTNLGMFMSRSARISTPSSAISGLARLSDPAWVSTDFMARSPKS